ncbi:MULTISPECIES: HAMP domain-containing sensor histidine kinase [Streptomyces]|uniref:histidine kinase n=1 Tax=Streptomyces edwardsiae TaxID=3075527 RepID=A0ABU2Q2C4_9ACTN|nr:HAMP domain-containing sensor histidine kinase [Streptomyces sp. DSM 41636]MDT0398582.1 HAMP domain-containing sensor histidine kinase [Streptomyces sp. DSM 41636]
MNGPARRVRALPIRARLSLLVAAAVAFAVAAVAVACWFVVKSVLVNSLDEALKANRMDGQQVSKYLNLRTGLCAHDPVTHEENPFGSSVQLVDSKGGSCLIIGTEEVPLTDADRAVAEGTTTDALHQAKGADGGQYRVFTYTVPGLRDVAVSAARPLSEVNSSLSNLALVLVFVAGAGVVGAAAAGLWVARTALRPVDRLTEAVEHVARTEDLGIRIPVEGESEDEIARLSRSFNSMTSALASSRDLQQQLIADAGHELRTPLTSLRTNIELLTRSEETGRPIPEADRKALLASVKAQMTELAALIGDLQELSRPDTGQHAGRAQIVAWQDVVGSALRRARLRGPELTITADVHPWYVRAEPSALERAVVNILDNAVKFSPAGATVDVRLTDGVLTVRDHGPGIPADELPYVFDRFWRSPGARALPGSGLGLSIVARTVQQAGGEVSLARADGGGTTATIRLPGAPTPPPEVP